LTNRLLQLGAQVVCDRAESDEQHPEGVDGALIPWLVSLRTRLLELHPLPEGLQAIPDDVLLEPKWTLQRSEKENKQAINGESNGLTPKSISSIPNGITATIDRNDRITAPSHWQDVRHLRLHLEGQHDYVPGDVLVIYPKNFLEDVEHVLRICDCTSIADDELVFAPTDAQLYGQDPKAYPTAPIPPLQDVSFTLRDLLTHHLDIMSIPRRSFFAHLIHYTSDEFHIERLKEFTNPEFIDELFDYTTRPRRSILEVLDEFDSVKLPWQKICSIIPTLRGRQFSIASGGSLKACPRTYETEPPKTNVELAIAIVKYRTVIKRIRQGVCTRYVADLQPGQQITVTLQKGGLSPKGADMLKPVVMIGPGTGVAPMRSLIYERERWRAEYDASNEDGADDILFFGCRNAESDYLFKEEWERLGTKGSLKTFAAFSRDQVRYSIRTSHPND
jgi:sulfite reductase alpha subunit-like flavoprotein